MKKNNFIKSFIVVAIILICACSCNSFEQLKKNFQSDFGGGLDRKIVITNLFTGEEVWSYTGKSYIDDNSSVGNITIIYYEGTESKKADFIGEFYGVKSIEF